MQSFFSNASRVFGFRHKLKRDLHLTSMRRLYHLCFPRLQELTVKELGVVVVGSILVEVEAVGCASFGCLKSYCL